MKAVLIIAFENFRDEEYAEPKAVLEKAGVEVTTASSKLGMAKGKLGMSAKVDILLKDVKASDYDAVLFVGGSGSYGYYDDPTAHKLARETVKEGKILGAICAAPGILSHAGLLKGKKATATPSEVDLIKQSGAIYTNTGVVADEKLITADGPQSAKAWGEAILKALKG